MPRCTGVGGVGGEPLGDLVGVDEQEAEDRVEGADGGAGEELRAEVGDGHRKVTGEFARHAVDRQTHITTDLVQADCHLTGCVT